MELGTKLMTEGFNNANATNRQAMANQAAMDQKRYEEASAIRTEKRAEDSAYRSNLGSLTQIIAEFDDVIDNADMNDPVAQERVPALIRKREQLAQLLAERGRNGKYLGGILKQANESGFLTPEIQGKTRETLATRMKQEAEKKANEAKAKEGEKKETPHETPSNNVITL